MVNVVMVLVVFMMLKISPLSDVMVSDGDCCNGDGSNYYGGDVENLTTG